MFINTRNTAGPHPAGSRIVNRRRVLQGAALAAAALPLAACGRGGAAGKGGEVTSLKVLDYYADEPDNQIFQKALEAAAEQVGVTIEREAVSGTGLIQKVLQMSSSRTLPDLLMLDNPDLQQIAATGALAPLSTFGITSDGFIDGFVGAGTYDGELYGMGPCANTLGLYYNKDLLNAAGVAVPTTWDELKATAKTLTKDGAYGVAFCAKASYEGSWQFLPFFWSAGADETDIASPEAASALQLLVDLVNEGSASQSVVNWGQGDLGDQFTSGKAAMIVNGPWMTNTFNDSGINWGVAEIPVPKAGATGVSPLGGELWTVPATGDEARQKKAAELLSVLLGKESILELNTTRFTIPTREEGDADYLAELPDMEPLVTAVNNGRSRTAKLGEAWPKTAEALYNAMQSALTGKAAPLQALQTAKADFVS
ncbi:carbohydrate ABC transporter substrate-binding protein, CUT1 family [Actinomyces ruminicola]|uniref:Carbohydrate ABC transporter substrate-binding protein, CUT1 family n=1 Tax=Actinomyces ruminicola TaxID=332524 RepID=A0A1H0BGB4_9ACTO|nr:sugar ABC transporter substrate-binding protein [Actinomyces ruminicola]SDN44660.1 carbohydrate ABC transporter substrate-binding protein, CUT1 family [Actinomyces ruminicola]